MYNYKPVLFSFKSILNCDDTHNIIIEKIDNEISDSFAFSPAPEEKPFLENEPPFFGFSSVLPGSFKTENITITARNGDVDIQSININNEFFEIDSGNISSAIVLPKDESINLRLKYSPQDSAIVFTKLEIESNACNGNTVLITGGFPNTPPRSRTLELVYPNGGETLIIGDTAMIQWQGLLPADVIQLEYSTNGGNTWDTLALDMTRLEYPWEVPDILSDECLIRVIQLWPNNIGQTLNFRHNNAVTSANFNSDGSRIITSSTDTTARIWNSNTGVELFRLDRHLLPVLWANFSPNDKLAVTASEDNTAIIWDATTGQYLRTLEGHTGDIRSANFSHDGRYIVTSAADGFVFVWDPMTGDLIDTVFRSTIPVWHSEFSHDNNYIIFSDVYGDVRIYDLITDETRTLKTVQGVCPYATISPDGTKVAAASWFGKCWVWDFATGDTLYTLEHPNNGSSGIKIIHSANFSSDSEILLTAAQDFNAVMWNADNGEYIATLKEHNASVVHGSFNFDDVRVLTASRDSTAKVWNLDKRDLQMDSSDTYFSISRAELQSYDIDFGKVPIDDVVDTLIYEYIINISNFDFEVYDIYIQGEHSSDFYMLDGFAPYRIEKDGRKGIEIRFNPTALGERRAELVIEFPASRLVQQLTANVYDPGLELVTRSVDFGEVERGAYKDTLLPIVLRNRSTEDIKILSINNLSVDLDNFDILSGGEPVTLRSGQTHQMEIRFTPDNISDFVGMIDFVHNDPGNYPVRMYLYGKGIEPRIDTATISIASFSGYPGDIVDVPITLKNVGANGIKNSITGFSFDLYFNSTLLEPLNVSYPIDIENNIRKLEFDLPLSFVEDSILTYIQFKVGLGNDTASALDIDDIFPIGKGKIVLSTEDGEFTLLGVCEQGDKRLFESDGRIMLSQNKPNPFSDKTIIEFEVIEDGKTSLVITDLLGNQIKSIIDEHLAPGIYTVEFDSKDMNNGTYFYILKTPTKQLVRRMTINK
jgi:WD40 repeat protein